jgi:hypothetical protein
VLDPGQAQVAGQRGPPRLVAAQAPLPLALRRSEQNSTPTCTADGGIRGAARPAP